MPNPDDPPQGATVGAHPIVILLVDDQKMVGEAVRRMLEPEKDIQFFYCQDPSRAIEAIHKNRPTTLLLDLVMPEIDGLTLLKFIRADKQGRDIPTVVLSSKEEAIVKAEAFALGANDYLVKLPDRIELLARIRYHSRAYIAFLQRDEAMRQLRMELKEAADYVMSLLPMPLKEGPVLASWRFVPSTSLGGDAFGYHRLDEDRMAIYLLDVCGHGVGAALLSVTVLNILRSQSLPGADFTRPAAVLQALNAHFQMEDHHGLYFTIWYGVYERSTQRIVYASGGHPPALFFPEDPSGPGEAHALMTKNMGIGIMPDTVFSQAVFEMGGGGRLYVFSDGVYEVSTPEGAIWSLKDFTGFMTASAKDPRGRMDALLHKVREVQRSESLPDDFSIVELVFP